jgi:hypothetical protein
MPLYRAASRLRARWQGSPVRVVGVEAQVVGDASQSAAIGVHGPEIAERAVVRIACLAPSGAGEASRHRPPPSALCRGPLPVRSDARSPAVRRPRGRCVRLLPSLPRRGENRVPGSFADALRCSCPLCYPRHATRRARCAELNSGPRRSWSRRPARPKPLRGPCRGEGCGRSSGDRPLRRGGSV